LAAISPEEGIVMDKGFTGFTPSRPHGKWLIKRKKPKNQPLSKADSKLNAEIELVRRPIEKCFGDLRIRFGIFNRKYRHDREWFTSLLHFGCALHNLINQY
jgi:hypothetical protein